MRKGKANNLQQLLYRSNEAAQLEGDSDIIIASHEDSAPLRQFNKAFTFLTDTVNLRSQDDDQVDINLKRTLM